METEVLLLKKERYGTVFQGLILPEAYERLPEEEVFLIGATEDDVPVGAAVWKLESDIAQLLSIAVIEDHRRQGIGTAMLQKSISSLRQLNCMGAYVTTGDEDIQLNGLLHSFGMEKTSDDAASFCVKLEDAAKVRALYSEKLHTLSLKDVPNNVYHYFVGRTFKRDGNLWDRELFDSECSRFIISDKKIVAGIFVENKKGELSVAWLHSNSNKPIDLIYLFQDALTMARKKYAPDTPVYFTCFGTPFMKLVEKLLGDKVQITPIQKWSLTGYKFRLSGLEPEEFENRERFLSDEDKSHYHLFQ